MKKKLIRIGLGVGSLLVAGSSFAVIDVTAATTAIGDGSAAAIAIGGAALAVLGAAAAMKYVRRAF